MAFAINSDGIYLLVDMNGHTLSARTHVVALKPAPHTIFDQGFAGSSGGSVSYLNAHRVSAPPGPILRIPLYSEFRIVNILGL